MSRDGGIGRHSGLKIRCSYGRAGSIPALATILSFTPYGGKKRFKYKEPPLLLHNRGLVYRLRKVEVLQQPLPLCYPLPLKILESLDQRI